MAPWADLLTKIASAINNFFNWLNTSQLLSAGRAQAKAEAQDEALTRKGIADDIEEDAPVLSDADLLDGL